MTALGESVQDAGKIEDLGVEAIDGAAADDASDFDAVQPSFEKRAGPPQAQEKSDRAGPKRKSDSGELRGEGPPPPSSPHWGEGPSEAQEVAPRRRAWQRPPGHRQRPRGGAGECARVKQQ